MEDFLQSLSKLNGRLRKISIIGWGNCTEDCGRFLSYSWPIERNIAEVFSESELTERKIAEDFSHTLSKLNGRLRKIFVLPLAN